MSKEITTMNCFGEKVIIQIVPRAHEIFNNRTWKMFNLNTNILNEVKVSNDLIICDLCNKNIEDDLIHLWITYTLEGYLGDSIALCKSCCYKQKKNYIKPGEKMIIKTDVKFGKPKITMIFGLSKAEIKEIINKLKKKENPVFKQEYNLDPYKISVIKHLFWDFNFGD